MYATPEDLAIYLGAAYTPPADPEAERLLQHASDVIDKATLDRAGAAYTEPEPPDLPDLTTQLITEATCAQVEFWLEFGEEHDVVGLRGSAGVGALSISNLPAELAPRAKRLLRRAGLMSRAVGVVAR